MWYAPMDWWRCLGESSGVAYNKRWTFDWLYDKVMLKPTARNTSVIVPKYKNNTTVEIKKTYSGNAIWFSSLLRISLLWHFITDFHGRKYTFSLDLHSDYAIANGKHSTYYLGLINPHNNSMYIRKAPESSTVETSAYPKNWCISFFALHDSSCYTLLVKFLNSLSNKVVNNIAII